MEEKNNTNKIYLVIIVFIMIIGLSAYVVIDRIIDNKNNKEIDIDEVDFKDNDKLNIDELSLSNKTVKRIYNYFNNERIQYYLYLDKNKNISWDSKSLIVAYNLRNDLENVLSIDSEEFEKKYIEIFGDFSNNEVKHSKKCSTTTYNIEENTYTIDLSCYEENSVMYKTFFKNIVLDKDDIVINKYYVFLSFDKENNLYSLYRNSDLKEKDLIISNIDYSDINNYINDMDTISYVFKKNNKNNYYFAFVK